MVIDKFDGPYSFLSNFFNSNFSLELTLWPTVEHWYQAHKSKSFTIQEMIRHQRSPYLAKKYGKKIELRHDWEEVKLDIMYQGVKAKFDQNYTLRQMLVGTKNFELIEGNTWGDTFWGVCNGVGENHLGKILMRIREEYKRGNNVRMDKEIF